MSESGHRRDVPRELRAALDAWCPTGAREPFRAGLAVQFISGETAVLSESEQRAVEEQLAWWRPSVARPAFRAALRKAFVAGRLAEGVPFGGSRAPILRWRASTVALLAAAAALVLWLGVGLLTPKGWHVVDSSIHGEVLVNGERVAFADSVSLDRSFSTGGCLVKTTSEALQLVSLGEGIVLEMIPDTEFKVLERQPGDELLTIELSSGGVRVATCPSHGDCVRVRTPDGVVTLSGRALGVTVFDEGTCLCVLDGQGTLSPLGGGASTVVAANTTAWLPRETREVELDTEVLHHQESLASFATVSDRYFY